MKTDGQEMLKTRQLGIGYNGKALISDINVGLNKGDIVALAGPNGAGKSTLFKTLTCNIKPVSGEIILMGRELSTYKAAERASLFSIVLTEKPDDMFLKVFDIVATGRYPHLGLMAHLKDEDEAIVMQSLETVGISALANRNFVSLSDGEKQKVMIAKALAQDTPIIYMDEPAAFLDYPSKIELMHLMTRLAREQGKAILFSSHDLELLLRYSDQMWLVAHKKALLSGTPSQLLKCGAINDYFNIDAATLFQHLT